MKRTIESIKENEVVHCPTEELAVKFCQMLKKAGKMWYTGKSYDVTNYDIHKQDTCYCPRLGLLDCIEFYRGRYYTITPVTDFIDTKPDTFYVTSDSPMLMKAWWEEMKKIGYYSVTELHKDTDWKRINNNPLTPKTKQEWLSMYMSCNAHPGEHGEIHFTLPADFNKSLDYARQALEYWEPNVDGFIEWIKTQPADKIAGSELYNEYKTELK